MALLDESLVANSPAMFSGLSVSPTSTRQQPPFSSASAPPLVAQSPISSPSPSPSPVPASASSGSPHVARKVHRTAGAPVASAGASPRVGTPPVAADDPEKF